MHVDEEQFEFLDLNRNYNIVYHECDSDFIKKNQHDNFPMYLNKTT